MGSSIKYLRRIFRKTNISNPLIRTRTCVYQGVKNVSFSENFAYVRWLSLPYLFLLCQSTISLVFYVLSLVPIRETVNTKFQVQANLEKYTFLKNLKGNSGKIWIFGRKSGKTREKFFMENFFFKTLSISLLMFDIGNL